MRPPDRGPAQRKFLLKNRQLHCLAIALYERAAAPFARARAHSFWAGGGPSMTQRARRIGPAPTARGSRTGAAAAAAAAAAQPKTHNARACLKPCSGRTRTDPTHIGRPSTFFSVDVERASRPVSVCVCVSVGVGAFICDVASISCYLKLYCHHLPRHSPSAGY